MTNDELLALITNAYSEAEIKILTKLQQLILLGMTEDEAADTLRGKKLQQLRTLRQFTVQQLRSLAALDDVIKGHIITANNVGTNSAALNNLLADYLRLLQDSRFQILRQTDDSYRSIVAQVVQPATLGVSTRIQTARRALDKFAGEGITAFISKDGRRWDIQSYVSMATQTTLANAQREGRLANLDGDLIIINAVPNPSPLCAPYKRKVLSISGKDTRYPSLQNARDHGLFHPQCRHSFTAYIPGLTKITVPDESDNYDATQDLRYAERQVRKYQRRLAVADTPEQKQRANMKIAQWRDTAKEVANTNDLVVKPNRFSTKAAR